MQPTPADLNRQGIELKQQGRFEDAVDCYCCALELQPDFAEAKYNLGVLWRDLGRTDLALECLEATVTLRPDVALVHFEFANLLAANREFERAVRHYQTATSIESNWPAAEFNLGSLLLDQRRWAEAEASYRRVLKLTPLDADAWTNLGTAVQEQGKLAEAQEAYRQAVQHKPDHAAGWVNLGNVLKSEGQIEAARECYERAKSFAPTMVTAFRNLGNTLLELGQFEAALSEYTVAAQLCPSEARSYVDLANVLHRLGRSSRAIEAYQQAIHYDGDCPDAWLNLGHLLRGIGDSEQAGAMYRELARRQPTDALHRVRVAANCPLVFRDAHELEQYRAEFLRVANEAAGTVLKLDFARLTVAAPECPYNLQFMDGNVRPWKKAYADLFTPYFAACRRYGSPCGSQSSRLRIGFVVTAGHEAAFLKLLAGVVERLNPQIFEKIVLCSRLGADRLRAGLRRDEIAILDFAERFESAADTVWRAECDLLHYLEVGTDPTNYFLPFLRLAPIQVTSWGIQVTSGIPTLDAYLSSALVETPSAQDHYTERLWLGSTLLTYQIPVRLPPRPKSRFEFGLPAGRHLYGCVQNLGKFHSDFDRFLAGILRRDEEGVLVVARDEHSFAADTLCRRWRLVMPDVVDRICFVPPQRQPDYLALLSHCDVLLDPTHFGGVTTLYDALSLAKPVVTLPSEFHRGRYTAACLGKIGVTETIARDLADYVNIAVELAADTEKRAEMAQRIRAARHLAFEDREAVREHERIFQELLAGVR